MVSGCRRKRERTVQHPYSRTRLTGCERRYQNVRVLAETKARANKKLTGRGRSGTCFEKNIVWGR